jgi:hypothetical protein
MYAMYGVLSTRGDMTFDESESLDDGRICWPSGCFVSPNHTATNEQDTHNFADRNTRRDAWQVWPLDHLQISRHDHRAGALDPTKISCRYHLEGHLAVVGAYIMMDSWRATPQPLSRWVNVEDGLTRLEKAKESGAGWDQNTRCQS